MAVIIEHPRARPHVQGLIMGTTVAMNLGIFLFHVIVARAAQPATYGAVAGVVGLLVVFSVPASAFQGVLSKTVHAVKLATNTSPAEETLLLSMGRLFTSVVGVGVAIGVLVLLIAPLLRSFLHLPSLLATSMIAAYVLPVALGLVPKGLLLEEGRYVPVALAMVAGSVSNIGVAIVVLRNGNGLAGLLGALVGGELVTASILLFSTRSHLRFSPRDSAPHRVGVNVDWRDGFRPALGFVGFWLLTTLDVILARHYVPGAVSGQFSAAATAAELALFIPGMLAALVFPRVARSGGGNVTRSRLTKGVLVVVVFGALPAVGVSLWAKSFVTGVFGGRYLPAAQVVGRLTIGGAVLGLVLVLFYFQVTTNGRCSTRMPWGGVVVLLALSAFHHAGALQLADNFLASSLAVGTGLAAIVFLGVNPPPETGGGRPDLARRDAEIEITIVVPYYNPGRHLAPTVVRLLDVLDTCASSFEVIAVSDGTTDGSERSIDSIEDPRLRRVVLRRNMGKGAALRIGLAEGRGRWLGFIDADGDLDPSLFEPFQVLTHLYDPEIIFGSKRHPLSEIHYPKTRHIYSWTYFRLIHVLFNLDIQDTQTGIKLIRRDVLTEVLPHMREQRFAFDLELFVVARRLGFSRFLEAPIRLNYQYASTVRWRSVRAIIFDTVAIFFRLRLLHRYDQPLPPPSPEGGALHPGPPRWPLPRPYLR